MATTVQRIAAAFVKTRLAKKTRVNASAAVKRGIWRIAVTKVKTIMRFKLFLC